MLPSSSAASPVGRATGAAGHYKVVRKEVFAMTVDWRSDSMCLVDGSTRVHYAKRSLACVWQKGGQEP